MGLSYSILQTVEIPQHNINGEIVIFKLPSERMKPETRILHVYKINLNGATEFHLVARAFGRTEGTQIQMTNITLFLSFCQV